MMNLEQRNERALASAEASLLAPPEYVSIGQSFGDGDDIYEGDEVAYFYVKQGVDVVVLNDVEHLQAALKAALGALGYGVGRAENFLTQAGARFDG